MELNKNLDKELLYTPIQLNHPKNTNHNININKPAYIDTALLITVVILTMIGLVMVYSVTLHSGIAFLKGQIMRICIGFFALIVAININYKSYQGRLKDILLVITILLLVFTLIMGKKVAEAKRWALFFQPAEFAKFTLIMWLSGYFANLREKQRSFGNIIIKQNKPPFLPMFIVGLTIILLLLQPAVGTSVILTLSSLSMFYINGMKIKYLFFITLTGIIIFSVSILTIPYANKRFKEFRAGTSYQQLQSRIAIGSGGIFGKGLGEGKQKLFFLPKLHTDFIYSAIGEEFGFIGSFVILLLFFVLFSRGLKISMEINDDFGQLLASGIVIVIFQYFLVHFGVALSLLPTTGQPLPFISYGGSAIVTNLYAIGIVLNISKYRRKKINDEFSFNYNRRHRRSYIPGTSSR
jgi:cell division protein FtsW